MIRALPAPLAIPWLSLVIAGWLLLNVALLAHDGARYLMLLPHDWTAFTQLPQRWAAGTVYEPAYWFVWSPILAWLFAVAIIPLGYSWWLGLHLAALVAVRNWWIAGLTLASVPFWVDTIGGNTFVFAFAAGAWALRGSRSGAIAYLAMCALMPRPVQAPLALWLLWQRPDVRVPAIILALVTIGVALATGYLDDWLAQLVRLAGINSDHFANLSPTKIIGSAWLLVGVPLAAWLTWKGWTGLAGLAMSPYTLPGYLLVLLWELGRRHLADGEMVQAKGLRGVDSR